MAAKRNAIIVAAQLEVHCPHCGDPQPNPDDGSHLWIQDHIVKSQGAKVCNACDEPFTLMAQDRVSVVAS